MSEETFSYFLQMTDRWSKRRFALKLNSKDQFTKVGEVIDYLQGVSPSDLKDLISKEKIGELGAQGLDDMQTILYHVDDEGNLGKMIDNIKIKQRGKSLDLNEGFKFKQETTEKEGYGNIYIADLIVDRDNIPFVRNWPGFYKRKWENNPKFQGFVESVVQEYDADNAEKILSLGSQEDKVEFLSALGQVIFNAPYELYSRFIGRKLKFKNGPETLDAIISGRGGNCSEKAAAFEFLAQNYGFDTGIVLGGDEAKGKFPYDTLRYALDEWNFNFKREAQRYWDHFANVFNVDGTPVFVDTTGGPVPFVFAVGDEAEAYLTQQKSNPVQFVTNVENYYYHDGPDDLTHDVLYSQEAFFANIDIQHVLGPEDEDCLFGLLHRHDLWVCPSMYMAQEEFNNNKHEWKEWAAENTDRIESLEVYANMNSSQDKALLSEYEQKDPIVMADIRTAGESFLKRCRSEWREPSWNMGYVFVKFKEE